MASGTILEECPVCKEYVWEDEDYALIDYNGHLIFVHEECMPDESGVCPCCGQPVKKEEPNAKVPSVGVPTG